MNDIGLRIDPEFQNKIPPLTDDEFDQLRENILKDGEVYEPIVVWEITIIDGHNRWKIIQEHPEIPYHIRKMQFLDKWAAFDWMFKKQLGRRNLSNEQRTDLIGRMYEARKKSVGGQEGNVNAQKRLAQNGPIVSSPTSTAESVAKEMGIARNTVKRAEKYSHGIDAIRDISDAAASAILRGGSGVKKKTVMDFPQMEPNEQKKLAKDIVSGETKKSRATSKKAQAKPCEASPSGVIQSTDPKTDSSTVWDPVQHKRIDPLVEQINADVRDLTRVHEYTIEDMLEEMRAISAEHTSQLHRVLVIRKTVLATVEARDAVFAFITDSINALEELRELVQASVA